MENYDFLILNTMGVAHLQYYEGKIITSRALITINGKNIFKLNLKFRLGYFVEN